MKLSTVQVGVPIFWLQSSVEHSVVRKPTVFERMIMRLSRRGVESSAVGDATLREAFEEHLGATGIPKLLETSAGELLRLGMLHRADRQPGESVLDQRVRTLTLTSTGEEFYNRNTLPSHPTKDSIEFHYLPWLNSLVSERPSRLSMSQPALSFDPRVLSPLDPSSLVRATLKDRPPRFLKGESRIMAVEVDVDKSVNWLTLDVDLVVSREGYLTLHVEGNKAASDWLARLEPALVQTTILDGVVSNASRGRAVFTADDSRHVTALELAGPANEKQLSELLLPELDRVILLDADASSAYLLSNEDGKRTIRSAMPTDWPADLVSMTLREGRAVSCRKVAELPITWAGRQIFARVQAELDAEVAGPEWNTCSDVLAVHLVRSSDPAIAVLPLAWSSPRPLQVMLAEVEGLPVGEVLQRSLDFILAARDVAPSFLESQAPLVLEMVTELISSSTAHQLIGIDYLVSWTKSVQDAIGASAPLGKALSPLFDHVQPASSAIEVRELLQFGQLAGSIPAELINTEVLAALVADLWRDPTTELGVSDHEAVSLVASYGAAQKALDATLGRQNPALARESGAILAAGSVGAALDVADRWLEVVEDPNLVRVIDGRLPESLLSLRDDVLVWREIAVSKMAESLHSGEVALVFDSNSLLDEPELLRHLRSAEVGVIPNRVIQELDGLKRSDSEDTARRARATHRAIDEVRKLGKLRFETARPSLVPADLGSSDEPDNQILSVAIAYGRGDVVLVTRDNNLRAKAQSTGVPAKTWQEIQNDREDRP